MKNTTFYFMGILASLFFCALAFSGTLEPSGSKDEYKTYTLEGIYQRLDSGAAGTETSFAEPTSNESTGHTVNQIMDKAPKVDAANGAGASDVGQGKTFWGLKSGAGWGLLTGSLEANTGSPLFLKDTTTDGSAGYYIEIDLKRSDSDLSAENIKKGVTIFGVTGTYEKAEAFVAKTGQEFCYNGDLAAAIGCGIVTGNRITKGQDGDHQKGESWPDPRFTDNNNGTVTDKLTGLVWLKNANCDGVKKWVEAVAWANKLSGVQCGLSDGSSIGDWRLPNIKEVQSLIDFGQLKPAFPSAHPFTNVQNSKYWSSTLVNSTNLNIKAWGVKMESGDTLPDSITNTYNLWAVKKQAP